MAASEIRRLHRKTAQLDRRLARAAAPGKVASVDHGARTLRLEIGRSADGRPILSPPVRWQQPGAGILKMHAPPKVGEQMTLQSPSGTIGSGSLALWGTYDKDNAAPSKAADAAVLQVGDGSITLADGAVTIVSGGTRLTLTPGGTTLTTPRFDGVQA